MDIRLNEFDAVIFDMDGLLLDTEPISMSTFFSACRECNFEPDEKVYLGCIGTNAATTKKIFIDGFGRDFPYEKIAGLWREKYNQEVLARPVPVKSGALSLLKYLEKERVRKAVATSSRHQNAVAKLAKTGILPFFEFVLGGDQVVNGKPDPEMYLTACRYLGVQSARCLVLEDSDNGIISASRAGASVIQIPDLLEPSAEVRSLGHLILKSLSDVEGLLKRPCTTR